MMEKLKSLDDDDDDCHQPIVSGLCQFNNADKIMLKILMIGGDNPTKIILIILMIGGDNPTPPTPRPTSNPTDQPTNPPNPQALIII